MSDQEFDLRETQVEQPLEYTKRIILFVLQKQDPSITEDIISECSLIKRGGLGEIYKVSFTREVKVGNDLVTQLEAIVLKKSREGNDKELSEDLQREAVVLRTLSG